MQPLSDSSSSSFGTADLVGLAVDRHLTEQQALLRGPGMDHMQRRLARDAIERAPQRLAVNGHHPPQGLGETLHEAAEAGLERLRVEQAEHSAEGVMAGSAMPQAQILAQVRRFDLSEQRHVRAILAARQQSAERDHQQLMQVVAGIVLPWVHNLGEAGDELFHGAASALDCTPRLQPCPLHRNSRVQASALYAIALASTPTPPMPASRIIRAASARIRARFSAACSLETRISPSCPAIT